MHAYNTEKPFSASFPGPSHNKLALTNTSLKVI